MRYLLLILVMTAQSASTTPREIDDHHWDGVERIVAIGDIHGDYDAYRKVLHLAGVTNRRGRWMAGHTHLVQTGDIADRGPDTLRIIRHLNGLARQARRAGGRVHQLIGNHEAMNVYGDLRYVSPGEFMAFVDSRSMRTRDRYFAAVMEHMREHDPDRYNALPDDYREQWNRDHPPGWVEHRHAWDPRWNPDGELYQWVMASKVAVQLNDMIFVHGGISRDYYRHDLASLTRMVHEALKPDDDRELGILTDETGPLWYRGLAGTPPVTSPETVSAILEHHNARHIVIGHTPTGGVIWPRHDASVILVDTGMSAYYGGHIGWLELSDGRLLAGYPGGTMKLPLGNEERLDYLERVMEIHPDNAYLKQRHQNLKQRIKRDELDDPRDEAAAGQPLTATNFGTVQSPRGQSDPGLPASGKIPGNSATSDCGYANSTRARH